MGAQIRNILNLLKQPFPYRHKKWQIVVIPVVCAIVIALILKPQGLAVLRSPLKPVLIISGMVAVVCAIVAYIFPLIFKKYYHPAYWTKGKFLSVPLTIVTLLVVPLVCYVDYLHTSVGVMIKYDFIERLFIWYSISLIIAFFPTFIIYINVLHSRDTNTADTLPEEANTVVISSQLKEKIELAPDGFLYAKVQGNYVTVYYLEASLSICKKTLRITLAQLMRIFENYSPIVRCHRGFLINTLYITELKRKQQNYIIRLQNVDAAIPVTPTYFQAVHKQLTQIKPVVIH
ncbi:LytTR family DNA-binding domain-containing protein [Dysgonomonas sp. 25]|uniref:LytTR family DNA-binding domain-containing protein n=1 Tax=Dysgonomonas sp. 25 TaxID=2302933 RepID=UPI0013D5F315|nr:LytTR family DNA-binding domain-containing protein [Dysgonomonas sp. 25]NDV69469.1 LytTR family transcriptional regulator [Dysgonomonas sp. 25]